MALKNGHRGAWSVVGGVMLTVFVALAVAAWQAGQTVLPSPPNPKRHIPEPAFALFVAAAALGLCLVLAPWLHWPPFRDRDAETPPVPVPTPDAGPLRSGTGIFNARDATARVRRGTFKDTLSEGIHNEGDLEDEDSTYE